MQTKHEHNFARHGRDVHIASDRGQEFRQLAAGTYLVQFNPDVGFYLTEQEPLTMPSKTYGASDNRAEKVLNTFISRQGVNTGVLLTGNKGSGKTLLSKQISVIGAEKLGLPTLLIQEPFFGAAFNDFISNIIQPCIINIDEYEKTYNVEKAQNGLLTLLDGTGTNNKLYVLTSNSEKINEFMLSRPNRLFYHWRYGKLDESVLVAYCEDTLKDLKHVKNIRTLWDISTDMSFDVLQSIVEELNRYPEQDFVDTLSDMNISLGDALSRMFILKSVTWGKEDLEKSRTSHEKINLVTFQEGDTSVNIQVDIPEWERQVYLNEELGFKGCWFQNTSLLKQVRENTLSVEDAKMYMEEEFTFKLNFDASQGDEITGSKMIFRRTFMEQPFEAIFTTPEVDRVEKYFRKLFD